MPGGFFSSSQEQPDPKEDQSEYRLPDEILIDPPEVTRHTRKPGSFENPEFDGNKAISSPFSLRFLSFLGLLFCSIYGAGMLFFALLTSLFSAVTLFQNSAVNRECLKYWRHAFNTLIAGAGFLLGIILPPLGLGFLLIYFSLKGEKMDTDILGKIIRRSFG